MRRARRLGDQVATVLLLAFVFVVAVALLSVGMAWTTRLETWLGLR